MLHQHKYATVGQDIKRNYCFEFFQLFICDSQVAIIFWSLSCVCVGVCVDGVSEEDQSSGWSVRCVCYVPSVDIHMHLIVIWHTFCTSCICRYVVVGLGKFLETNFYVGRGCVTFSTWFQNIHELSRKCCCCSFVFVICPSYLQVCVRVRCMRVVIARLSFLFPPFCLSTYSMLYQI